EVLHAGPLVRVSCVRIESTLQQLGLELERPADNDFLTLLKAGEDLDAAGGRAADADDTWLEFRSTAHEDQLVLVQFDHGIAGQHDADIVATDLNTARDEQPWPKDLIHT